MEYRAKTTFIATGFVQVTRQSSTSNFPRCVPPYAPVASSPVPTAGVEVEVEVEPSSDTLILTRARARHPAPHALSHSAASLHPHNPSLSIQQHAMRPARPTPPRQCARMGIPRSVYCSSTRVRWPSRCAGERGARPSGMGMRRTSSPRSLATFQYSDQEAPRNSSSVSSKQLVSHV